MGIEGLNWQLVDVRFDKGLDTRTQKKLVLPGKWTKLENLTLSQDYTLRRRSGVERYAVLPPAIEEQPINGLATYNKELLAIAGLNVATTITSIGTGADEPATTTQAPGALGWVDLEKTALHRSNEGQFSFDCATLGQWTAYVWVGGDSSGNLIPYILITDEATGAHILFEPVSASVGTFSVRIVAVENSTENPETAFIVFFTALATGEMYGRVYGMSPGGSPVSGIVSLLVAGPLPVKPLDACAGPDGPDKNALVIYVFDDLTTSMRGIQVTYVALTPIVVTTLDLDAEATQPFADIAGIGCAPAPNNILTTTWGSGGIGAAIVDTSISPWVVSAGPNALAVATAADPDDCRIVGAWLPDRNEFWVFTDNAGAYNTAAIHPIIRSRISATATLLGYDSLVNSATFSSAASTPSGPQGPFLAGKPFVHGLNSLSLTVTVPLFVFENYSGLTASSLNNTTNLNTQQSMYFLDGNTGAIVGKALYGTLGDMSLPGDNPIFSTPCSTPSIGTDSTGATGIVVAPEKATLVLSDGANISPSNLCRLSMRPKFDAAPIVRQLGQSLYFAAGSLSSYDGANVVEHGFYLGPEGVNVFATAAGAMTAGVHQVVAVYEWVDNAGQRHQSLPSTPQNPGIDLFGGNGTITVSIPTLQMTQKTDVRIVLFATAANGLTFYRILTYGSTVRADGLKNDKSVAFITTTIETADADFTSNELLYAQPNQAGTTLPNISPPPSTVLGIHQNRIWLNATDNPFSYWFSQQLTTLPTGAVGLQFSDSLRGGVPPGGGKITAFESLDEKQILFCERKIFVVYGTGPNAAGGFSNYSDPQDVPSDVGCIAPNSVLRIPPGIIFKSSKGWYLLGRDLTTKFIGAGVSEYDDNDVSSAVLVEDREEARFSSRTGRTLVYCYAVDQWSTFTYQWSPEGSGVMTAVWWPTLSRYMMAAAPTPVTAATAIFRELPGPAGFDTAYFNSGFEIITPLARLAFLHLGTLGGFQRVRWLYLTASANASPTSTLTIGVDFNDAYANSSEGSYTVPVDLALITFGNVNSIDLRHKLHRQKCKSVSFTFTETLSSPENVFLSGLQAMTLQVGLKRGTNKLPAAQGV